MGHDRINLSRWALEHPALTRYLMVVLLVMGFAAFFQLGQDEDPPFSFRAMVIRTAWPGATALQVSEQLTDKIERTLQEVPYADKIRSYSKPGESLVIFQVKDSSPPGEVSQLWYTVRKKIGDMQASLPSGIQGPYFNDEFGDTFGVIYALTAKGYSPSDLRDFSLQVRQSLLQVEDVGKVEVYGLQEERVYIELSRQRLAQYRLTVPQIAAQLQSQLNIVLGGSLSGDARELTLRLDGAATSIEALRATPLRLGSQVVRLGDIADVRRQAIDPAQTKVRFQAEEIVDPGAVDLDRVKPVVLANRGDLGLFAITEGLAQGDQGRGADHVGQRTFGGWLAGEALGIKKGTGAGGVAIEVGARGTGDETLEDHDIRLDHEGNLNVRAEDGHEIGDGLDLFSPRGGGDIERAANRKAAEIKTALAVRDGAESRVGRSVDGGDFRASEGLPVGCADVTRDAR
jgi:hypothetical protein